MATLKYLDPKTNTYKPVSVGGGGGGLETVTLTAEETMILMNIVISVLTSEDYMYDMDSSDSNPEVVLYKKLKSEHWQIVHTAPVIVGDMSWPSAEIIKSPVAISQFPEDFNGYILRIPFDRGFSRKSIVDIHFKWIAEMLGDELAISFTAILDENTDAWEINNLKNNLETTSNTVNFLETQVTRIADDNANIKTRMGNIETDNANIKTRMGNIETDNVGIKTRMGNIETDNAKIKTQIGNIETALNQIIGDH